MKDVRLLPLVIVAICALLALKGIGFVFSDAQIFGGAAPAMAQDAEEPKASDEDAEAGQGAEDPAEGEPASEDPEKSAEASEGGEDPSFLDRVLSSGSQSRDAILESLAKRREELEARDKELDLREKLMKAAELKVEERISELKELEARITQADEKRQEEDSARMKGLVTMYESMKPKDAARIFDRLDMMVVVKVASRMSARQMSAVLAEMDSEVAQRLTLELSSDPVDPLDAPSTTGTLPKIVGTRQTN